MLFAQPNTIFIKPTVIEYFMSDANEVAQSERYSTIAEEENDEDNIMEILGNTKSEVWPSCDVTGEYFRRTITYSFDNSQISEDIRVAGLRSQYYNRKNFNSLIASFEKELKKHSDYISVDQSLAYTIFKKTALTLSELPFCDSAVELTNQSGVKFILGFPNDKLLMVSKYFSEKGVPLEDNEIVFSLFFSRELIASNVAEIESFTEGVKEFLAM